MWLENDSNEQALIAQWKKENRVRRNKLLPSISYKDFIKRRNLISSFREIERAGLGQDELEAEYRRKVNRLTANGEAFPTYGEFVRSIQNSDRPEEIEDLRPDYAKPILDRYDPESDEYTQWKDIMNMWEEEDAARAEADVFMDQLMQKHLNTFNEANKKAEYDKLIENFSSNYKQNVDTTPLKRYHFI